MNARPTDAERDEEIKSSQDNRSDAPKSHLGRPNARDLRA